MKLDMKRTALELVFCVLCLHAYANVTSSENCLHTREKDKGIRISEWKGSGNKIEFVDNELFFLANGRYYCKIEQKYNRIDKRFFEEIISGNLFVLFNWAKDLRIEKDSEKILISLGRESFHKSKVLKELGKVFNNWAIYVSAFINNSIVINYEEDVSIDYEIDEGTLYIHKISGVTINHNFGIRGRFLDFLDIERYKLIYKDHCVFFGVSSDEIRQKFDYYVYTSIEDILDRGFSNVFKKSNEEIRQKMRPLVMSFF